MAKRADNFEQAMARLEEIVRTLESGSAPLDESLKLYEEGISCVRLCSSRLDEAEKKIKLLNVAAGGSVEETDFNNYDN